MAEDKDPLVVGPLEKVTLDEPKKFIYVSSLLSEKERKQLQLALLNNMDVFAWSHSDMIGINPAVAFYKINIIPKTRLVR